MGMVVRTNMAGLNANNALNAASKTQQNAMQKLASGFKINKAADDASGLAISEKMKNQIKALDTAKDNCEDGANLIQTAEGYMNETHDILNRMTELAEKAANGVLDDTDRDALQDEMDQLCGEIDRLATTANFNGKKLMDGTLGSSDSVRLTCDETNKTIKFSAPTNDVVNLVDANNANTATGLNIDVSSLTTLKSGVYTVSTDNTTIVNASGVTMVDENGTAYDVSAKYVAKAGDTIKIKDDGSVNDTKTGNGIATKTGPIADAVNGATYTFDGKEWVTNDSGVKKTLASSAVIDGTKAKMGKATFTITEGINLQIGESSTTADRLEVNINSFHTDTLFGGLDGFVNTTNDKTDTDATAAVKIKTTNDDSTYQNARSIDITDKDAASAAADAIRQISNYVSDERGKLGAQQNRLDHTINNLTTASENTTAANSRIRDTNMADEMMSYTSKNVIAQAAQAMLAQANSQPQNVLSLLQ